MSEGDAPRLSVVIPSFERRSSLEMVLAALAVQRDVAPGAAEVVVVLDGGTDDSPAMLEAWVREGRLPGLRWFQQPNGGQAAARHAGALAARAPVLLFLDDDVVPEAGLLACHLAHHARAAGDGRIAVLGDCEIVRHDTHRFYHQHAWSWWEETYTLRARAGRLPLYTDFCAGNVSLRRDDYLASGGFDPDFRGYGGEDYELGWRLLRGGVRFVVDRGARAMHHHRLRDYPSLLRQRRQEGRADVLLSRKHPELRAGRWLMKSEEVPAFAALERLAFTPEGMPDATLAGRAAAVARFERLGLRRAWAHRLNLLTTYAYWRGVHEALGSREALLAFRAEAPVPRQAVDVARGLPTDLDGFWVQGPSEVRVTAGGEPLGTVRLDGPVQQPLREALATAIARRLGAATWMWAARSGTALLPRAEAGAPSGRG